ncbi:MAG: response regulator [Cyanobacteria bacterium SZAS LIN-2]|nr:response regulator [Cyanobacteria bacterium SZAS LIN-2]
MNSDIVKFNSDASSEVSQGLSELSAAYLAELPSMSQLLRYDFICGKMNKDATLIETAAERAHQIRGTAGSLGFAGVSKIASVLDQLLTQAAAVMRRGEEPGLEEIGGIFDELDMAIRESSLQGDGSRFSCRPSAGRTVLAVGCTFGGTNSFLGLLSQQSTFDVEFVADGMTAISMLEDFNPGLIFIDESTAGATNLDICRMIRCNSKWSQVPIIVAVSDASLESRAAVFASGATDFVLKPVVADELRARIGAHLPPQ